MKEHGGMQGGRRGARLRRAMPGLNAQARSGQSPSKQRREKENGPLILSPRLLRGAVEPAGKCFKD